MTRRVRAALVAALTLFVVVPGVGVIADEDPSGPVIPDPAFLEPVPGDECIPETPHEKHTAVVHDQDPDAPRYGEICKRINFAFGPIHVKPGQNEAVIEPVDIEKPAYDGYIVRFKPDLVRSVDGSHPRTDDLHLHHATWLNLGESYGSGPFFAAGEEKTIAQFPEGYGMEVGATDLWGLLYMVHNGTPQAESVWLTYQIDYIAKADAEAHGIKPVKPIWLDVQGERWHPDAPSTGANPVFNAQRGFGSTDPETGTQVCTFPDQNCARFGTYGPQTVQQGIDVSDEVPGADWTVPEHLSGTLIGLGGHLHPGGLRDDVSLLRDLNNDGELQGATGDDIHGPEERMIFRSDAVYWDLDPTTENVAGERPVSWNLSMTVSGLPLGWAVDIEPGDVLRINATYDTEMASWYEGMGIVVALVAPELHEDDHSVDVFDPNVTIESGASTLGLVPDGPWYTITDQDGVDHPFEPAPCTPDLDTTDGAGTLCLRGSPTHPAIEESSHGGGCGATQAGECQALPDVEGPVVTDIYSVGFTYGNADLGVIGTTGIPRLVKDEPARFWNLDSPARIWHTFTRCEEPCNGPTGINYPLADGGSGDPNDEMDFDSGELGYGMLWEPAKSQIGGSKDYDRQWLEDGVVWTFTPTDTGTFTFWCRIHPGMRGAFEVIEPEAA